MMHPRSIDFSLPLFVPADRPERYPKAMAAGADCIIIDLEDAVAPADKIQARNMLFNALSGMDGSDTIVVRINPYGSVWHGDDVAFIRRCKIAGVMLPKTESSSGLRSVKDALGHHVPVIALIESAAGIAAARKIATRAHQLAFGSIDFASDVGCSHTRDALLLARSELVIASRNAGRPQPIDGVTTNIRDEATVEDDARYAASLGFGGKLLIHPAQVAAARRGLAPSDSDVSWARKVVDASSGSGAIAVDGSMVDAPVLARAHNILQRHDNPKNKVHEHDQSN